MKQAVRSKEQGFTLVELSIVVVAIAALSLIGAWLVPRVWAGINIRGEVEEFQSVAMNVKQRYYTRSNYNGVTAAGLASLNVFNPVRVSGSGAGSTVIDRWGGQVLVASTTISTPDDAVSFTYPEVPNYECSELVPKLEAVTRTISVNGTQVKPDGQQSDLSLVGTACTAGSNTIIYTVGRS